MRGGNRAVGEDLIDFLVNSSQEPLITTGLTAEISMSLSRRF